jgi:hypothetical protein
MAVCLFAWLLVQWSSNRAQFGWWTVIAFGVICMVALVKTVISNYVTDRVRRDARK